MALATYLNFDGNTREAVAFYEEVFGVSSEGLMTYGSSWPADSPFPIPEGAAERIMHARLRINGDLVMLSDTFPGMDFNVGNNISIAYLGKDQDEMRRLFARLSQGGTVDMALASTSWTPLYGQLTDKFGIAWQFNFDETLA